MMQSVKSRVAVSQVKTTDISYYPLLFYCGYRSLVSSYDPIELETPDSRSFIQKNEGKSRFKQVRDPLI